MKFNFCSIISIKKVNQKNKIIILNWLLQLKRFSFLKLINQIKLIKMFNKLFLICVLISIYRSNCVVLENICDVFRYNGTEVNSVFRMRFMIQFDTVIFYF